MTGKHAWLWLAAAAAVASAHCTDPGCIRNSECGPRFQCIEAACVLRPVDAGTPGPGLDDDAGSE